MVSFGLSVVRVREPIETDLAGGVAHSEPGDVFSAPKRWSVLKQDASCRAGGLQSPL